EGCAANWQVAFRRRICCSLRIPFSGGGRPAANLPCPVLSLLPRLDDLIAVGNGCALLQRSGDRAVFAIRQLDGVAHRLLVEIPSADDEVDMEPGERPGWIGFLLARDPHFEPRHVLTLFLQ